MGFSTEIKDFFLYCVRLGLWEVSTIPLSYPSSLNKKDWALLQELATQQGLSAVLIDGLEKLPESQKPPKLILLQWIGEVLQGYEYRYELYCRTIAEMAQFYNSHNYKMMVLKGYACGQDWPKPEHRPTGDIDIWLFGQQKSADAALAKEKGIEIDKNRHHHTVFYWHDFMVENHFDFLNIHHHKSNVEYENILKSLSNDDSHSVEVYGERVYLPSPNLHALFLLRHMMKHFASEVITLRQLLDWAFFVKAHGKEVDWPYMEEILDKFGMSKLYGVFNAICVEDLGFEVNIFQKVQFEPALKDRVLNEILSPQFSTDLPKGIIRRSIYKYRRWKGNAWKHELCYKESMWSAFWSGVWNHLLKPSSI